MLLHAKGNLIDLAEEGLFDVIVQGCNCKNVMGSGLAKEIRERYPAAYDTDSVYHRHICADEFDIIEKLGNYTVTTVNALRYLPGECATFDIVNAYTQVGFLPRGVDHFEYESFYLILKKLAVAYHGRRLGFPYIGCGLAGGNQERILTMLSNFASTVTACGGSATLVEF